MLAGVVGFEARMMGNALQYLYVSLSNLCDARCVYCDVHDEAVAFRKIDCESLENLFRQAKHLGVRFVHFMGGGEPLIDPNFPAAAEICKSLGLKIILTTNGSKLAEHIEGVIRDAELEAVIISIDSHHAEKHNLMRGSRRLFQSAMQGIAACQAVHPDTPLVINHVLTGSNIGDVEAFIEQLGHWGVQALNIIPLKDRLDLLAGIDQQEHFCHRLAAIREAASANRLQLLFDSEDVGEWLSRSKGINHEKVYRCLFPRYALYADMATGNVYPCDCTVHREPRTVFELGNIYRQSLASIWRGAEITGLREALASPCDPGCKSNCDWNNIRTNRTLWETASKSGALSKELVNAVR